MKYSRLIDLFSRYLIVLASSFKGLFIFYWIFAPLTVYLSYFLFSLFLEVQLTGNIISLNRFDVILTDSCIAGAAYFLLFLLNLSVPKVSFQKRILMFCFAFFSFLLFNVLRILVLAVIFKYNFQLFNFLHLLLWFGVSIFLVLFIWFLEVKIFKIREIPFYSDMKYLYNLTLKK